MPSNAVLERQREERGRQIAFVDELLSRAAADERDLVDAETANLTAAQQRIEELTAQIEPLERYEALVETHRTASAQYGSGPRAPERSAAMAGGERVTYSSPGHFLRDVLSARGLMSDPRTGQRLPADAQAEARIRYAVANQTTVETPGLLPHEIIGGVVNLIDASRPFITSIGGGRPMGGIPGKTFGRPKITTHTQVGIQATEKAQVPSRAMVIGEVAFTKQTYGGTVDVSRQDIDWTSPAAWDILIRDLADQYAIETENAAADAFAAGAAGSNSATAIVPPVTLANLAPALYAAAGKVYSSSKHLPDRIWLSTDLWGVVGPLLDNQQSTQDAGDSSLSSFAGNLYGVSRIVVPSFPPSTLIVGWSGAYEVYEEVIGLLTAVEPSLLGVEVAYGGYIAHNFISTEGVAPITGAAALAASSEKK